MARERKSKSRKSPMRRRRGAPAKTSEPAAQIPLRLRAAFANYLLHGLTPAQARMRLAEDLTEIVDSPHLAEG